MVSREPSVKKTVAPSSMNQTDRPLVPGFKGRVYGVCEDNVWHLILKIHGDGMADVQCSTNAYISKTQPPSENSVIPMCKDCVLLHFGRNR